MFLKKFFGKSEQPNPEESAKMPFNHPKLPSGAEGAQCPFINKKGGEKPNIDDDEDDKPRGGCPFMGGKDSQKNPPLQLTNECYDEIFVSKYRFFLSDSKIDFDFMETHKQKRNRSRQFFNQYPAYLQHTLFFNSEDFKAVRKLQCCSRFMPYEELREKGNKEFNKGNFARSIDFYQRAYSLFKWLEHEEPEHEPVASACQSLAEIESSIDLGERSRIQLNIDSEKQIPNKPIDDDFRKQHKQFFVLYCDENTKLCDGQQMTETYDTDMRKSLMVQILLNLASSYIMLSNYYLAYHCCSEAEALTNKMSQIQFRKAQSIVYNKSSSLQRLQEAKSLIETALQKKKNEKIFQETNPNILKMLNLHDSDEAYTKCLQKIDIRIEEVKAKINQKQTRLFERAAQIHRAELDIISRGMTPHQRMMQGSIYQTVEFRVIDRIKQKYLRVIDFYTESQKPDQVKAAKKELQQVLRVSDEMFTISNIKISDCSPDIDLGDRQSQKVIKRLQKAKLEQCQQHYNKARYNFQMLQWAIKEIVEQDAKKRQIQKKQKQQEQKSQGITSKIQSKHNYAWLLLLLPVLAIVASRFIFH